MVSARAVHRKVDLELTAEWNDLAADRRRQLDGGVDVSFSHVVVPAALRLLRGKRSKLLLDIGSGTGHFAALASSYAERLIGIEPSVTSVNIAREVCKGAGNVSFLESTVENVKSSNLGGLADSAVALMVLTATPDLSAFASAASRLLGRGATFVAVLPHPCFWPTYWGYADAPWFSYSTEIFVEANFSISNAQTTHCTTHVHRPLSQYLSVFSEYGFRLEVLEELMPSSDVERLYPTQWKFPRFLAMQWIRN
jgi:SAM-dependent methyltransferase